MGIREKWANTRHLKGKKGESTERETKYLEDEKKTEKNEALRR